MSILSELLSSRVKAEVLRLLFGPSAGELHVREIARRATLNDATVRQELKRLTRLGIIESRRDGNRTYYRASSRSPLGPALRSLVLKTDIMEDALRKSLQHPEIQVAFVFGSLAAGTARPESNVDLMVIGDIGLRSLGKQLRGAASELGREINPHVLTPGELSRRKKSRDHFVTTVLAAPKRFVIGDEDELGRMVR